jgi:hypothetical protein
MLHSLRKYPSADSTKTMPSSLPVPSLDKDHYPDLKFWVKKDYLAEKKNCKNSTGFWQTDNTDNKVTWYVETENGDSADGNTVKAICMHACSIWQYLLDNNMAPPTWSDASIVALNFFEHHMCHQYPQLALGADNWKAHMIATNNYSSWYLKHIGCNAKPKDKPRKSSIFKQSHSPSPQNDRKRAKPQTDLSTPVSSMSTPSALSTQLPTPLSTPNQPPALQFQHYNLQHHLVMGRKMLSQVIPIRRL